MRFDKSFCCAILSAVCYWAAFAPLRFSILVWFVPAFWAVLVGHRITGGAWHVGCFYIKIWIAASFFWLASFAWMASFSVSWTKALLAALSVILALFWLLFIALSRAAVWRLRIPTIIAAPLVWCGVEWIRKNYIFGGMPFASLEHTQYRYLNIIQIADLCGEYGMGMLIVFVGTCVGRVLSTSDFTAGSDSRAFRFLHTKQCAVYGCALALGLAVSYGEVSLHFAQKRADSRAPFRAIRIALLQGNIDDTIDVPVGIAEQRFAQYVALCDLAGPQVDLVVWPETACVLPLYEVGPNFIPAGWETQPPEAIKEVREGTCEGSCQAIRELARSAQATLLLGIKFTTFEERERIFRRNSAILVDETGLGPRYDKTNLVPFLESSSLAGWVPNRYASLPMFVPGNVIPPFPVPPRGSTAIESGSTRTITPDDRSPSSEPVWAAVNICFDSFFPSFIRREVVTLADAGTEPDVLINISNDGSCRFAAMTEMHLASHVFRAIENRKQYLSATNAGQAVWIEGTGRIVKLGESGQATFIIAEVHRDPSSSLYRYWGDWLPICCLGFNVVVLVSFGFRKVFPQWDSRGGAK